MSIHNYGREQYDPWLFVAIVAILYSFTAVHILLPTFLFIIAALLGILYLFMFA